MVSINPETGYYEGKWRRDGVVFIIEQGFPVAVANYLKLKGIQEENIGDVVGAMSIDQRYIQDSLNPYLIPDILDEVFTNSGLKGSFQLYVKDAHIPEQYKKKNKFLLEEKDIPDPSFRTIRSITLFSL